MPSPSPAESMPLSADPTSDENEECRVLSALSEMPDIFDAIAATSGTELARQAVLRKRYPDDLVRTAFAIHEMRKRAAGKFTRAGQMWLDRQGLEQSTAEAVANHKAKRFEGHVWDLCSGIGSDAIALASRGDVTALDINPAACWRTKRNSEVYGVSDRVETSCVDVIKSIEFEDLIHVDPDRRPSSSGRVSRIEDYVPGLEYLHELISRTRGGAIKVSPASNFGGKFPDAEIELISLHGECKEATVWFGELAGTSPFRATALPAGESISGHPLEVAVPVSPLGQYLYDPDPAVVRAGLVDVLADRLGLNRLDSAEEYLTADQAVDSPFVQRFETLSNLPNNERDLKAWIRTCGFGQLEIKCRHIPIQADLLRRKLPLSGSAPGVIIFARLAGKARIIGARRV